MGVIDKLLNKTLFIDTAPLIYFIEGHSSYHDKLLEVFKANDNGDIIFQTSTLTLLEVLVQPIRLNKPELANQYELNLTTSQNIKILDIDIAVSKRTATLWANYNLKTPDAIQMATGIENNADFFFTNDKDLKRVNEIQVLTLDDV
jgi:predicted nucleic acid-binding protein